MGLPVVTVASGGLPVVESTTGGTPVTEAANGYGVPVTKVVGKPGMPVVFETIGVVAPVTYATFDPATVTAVTLSGGNLIATNTGTTSGDQGARVASASGKTTGKYYIEATWTTLLSGNNIGAGIGTPASTYISMGNTGGVTGVHVFKTGTIWSNGSNIMTLSGGAWASGTACIAIDLDNRRIWVCAHTDGIWNNSPANNPATNIGGLVIPAGTMVPFCTFGGTAGVAGNKTTLNFGASAFIRAVPAGFTSGWPA